MKMLTGVRMRNRNRAVLTTREGERVCVCKLDRDGEMSGSLVSSLSEGK